MNARVHKGREDEGVRLPRAGILHIGKKEGNHPVSTDYFVPSGKYAPLFAREFGAKPQSITIVFPSDEHVCEERLECRDAQGRLSAYGDGKTFSVWNGKAYELREKSSDLRSLGTWKHIVTLRFLIPRISQVLGYWQLTTAGKESSVPNLVGTFDRVREIAGTVTRIPFDLNVEFAQSQKPGAKSRYPVLSLVPNLGQEQLESVRALSGRLSEVSGILTADKIKLALEAPTE